MHTTRLDPADNESFRIQIGRENVYLDDLMRTTNCGDYTDVSGQNLIDEDMATVIRLGILGKECKHLFLWNNRFTEKSMQLLTDALLRTSTITDMDISKNRIGDRGLRVLLDALQKRDNQIEEIDLSENGITDEGVQLLARTLPMITNLQRLFLHGNRISNQGLHALGDFLVDQPDKLKEIGIDDNEEIDDEGIDAFLRKIHRNRKTPITIYIRTKIQPTSKIQDLVNQITTANDKLTIFV